MNETRDVRVILGEPSPRDERSGAILRTPYGADFVEELKALVPGRERAWVPDDLEWWVSADYAERAIALVVHHFGETIVTHEDGSEEYRDGTGTTARQERFL